jgi:hypothetical protein
MGSDRQPEKENKMSKEISMIANRTSVKFYALVLGTGAGH